jgi:MFS transporter, OCT family, solute carrier family 22 (organic cation transporter), member 4/5
VETVAITLSILVVLKLGLRVNLVIYLLVAGTACLLTNFASEGNLWFILSLAMIGE